MTDVISTDLQGFPTRRLQKKFSGGTKAIGTAAPNSLNSSKPSLKDAMGVTNGRGIVSMMHDGAEQDFELYLWHEGRNLLDPSKGWVSVAETTALASKTCRPEAILSWKVEKGLPYFIQAKTAAVNNAWVFDRGPHKLNENTDSTNV